MKKIIDNSKNKLNLKLKPHFQLTGTIEADKPLLDNIPNNFYATVLTLRWIEFLLERVKRNEIPKLLEHYQNINWINESVKLRLFRFIRGEVQDVYRFDLDEEGLELEDNIVDYEFGSDTDFEELNIKYKKLDDWRLSAEDHMKSLLFIYKIKGMQVDFDRLRMLEDEIEKMR